MNIKIFLNIKNGFYWVWIYSWRVDPIWLFALTAKGSWLTVGGQLDTYRYVQNCLPKGISTQYYRRFFFFSSLQELEHRMHINHVYKGYVIKWVVSGGKWGHGNDSHWILLLMRIIQQKELEFGYVKFFSFWFT